MKEASLINKNVCLTGADGFIGSHLCEALIQRGAKVRALVAYNSFGSLGWLDSLEKETLQHVEIISGDIRDPHMMRNFVKDQDIVFHLAALIAIPYSYLAAQSYVDVNVTGTLNLLEACRFHEIERFVHTSTSEVYGTAIFTPITEDHPLQGQSPYSASKIAADYMVQAYHKSFELPAVTLRPFNTYGPRQSERAVIPTIIRQALDPDCSVIGLGDLTPIRDFNFVLDTVEAFISVGTGLNVQLGEVYNAGTGLGVTIGQTLELIQKDIGIAKPVNQQSARIRPKNSEVFELLADSSKLQSHTTWVPRTDIYKGLSLTVNWWRHEIESGRQRRGSNYMI
jgi:UDP-glucose 4-epimerase